MKWLAIIIILSATARAAQTNWPSVNAQHGKPVEKPETGKAKTVTIERFRLKADKKSDKDGKANAREFPMMFDIAQRAQKHKAKKAGKK